MALALWLFSICVCICILVRFFIWYDVIRHIFWLILKYVYKNLFMKCGEARKCYASLKLWNVESNFFIMSFEIQILYGLKHVFYIRKYPSGVCTVCQFQSKNWKVGRHEMFPNLHCPSAKYCIWRSVQHHQFEISSARSFSFLYYYINTTVRYLWLGVPQWSCLSGQMSPGMEEVCLSAPGKITLPHDQTCYMKNELRV